MKSTEMTSIQSLLKEDKNFCRTPKRKVSTEISSWSSDNPKIIQSPLRKTEKPSVPSKLPKISEEQIEDQTKALNKIPEKVQNNSKVGRPILNDFYIKFTNKLIDTFDLSKEFGLFSTMKTGQFDQVYNKQILEKSHYRSRSLQHSKPEQRLYEERSPYLVRKERKASKRMFYFIRPEKNVETEFLLKGKGDCRSKGNIEMAKDKTTRNKMFRSVESRVILPEIRLKSTISSFSLFNSGVPIITRHN